MNEKENFKVAVIESCINGTMTIKVAAERLNFSERYVKKLKARYKKFGASSMLHGNCGKQPKHTISSDIKSKIWEIWNLPEYKCQYINEQKIKNKNVQILRLCNLSRFIFYFFYFVFYSIGSTCNVNNMRVMQ